MSTQTKNTEFTHLTHQSSKPNSYKNVNSSQLNNLDLVLGWTGAGYEINKQEEDEQISKQEGDEKGDEGDEGQISEGEDGTIEVKYVITYDGIPKYFVNTNDECEKVMREYVRDYFNYISPLYDDTYTKIRIIITNYGYDVVEYNPYIPLFYDKVIHNLSFYKVKSI